MAVNLVGTSVIMVEDLLVPEDIISSVSVVVKCVIHRVGCIPEVPRFIYIILKVKAR